MSDSHHMSPEVFREWGHRAVDWIAEYLSREEAGPVHSRSAPGDLRAQLPGSAPRQGEPFEQIFSDLDRLIMPGITHWQSPNWFAYFPANNSFPSILGELLSAGLGVQGMLWSTSPAATELETHMLDWLAQMLALPEAFHSTGTGGGAFQDSASSATLVAILAARERATGGLANRIGARQSLTAYATDHAHSSIDKGVRIAGLGSDNLRRVAVDPCFALVASDLERLILADIAEGRVPAIVVATVGSTSSNALDPLEPIGRICREHGVWLHVDAAMSGSAAICPELRWIIDGIEWADSFTFNPHKWLFTNFDCNCLYVANRGALLDALSILPEYLRNEASESGQVIDYRDWQVPLGRRFRALKLWFVVRHYGVEGLQHHIRQHVAWAQELAGWIEEDPDFELVAPAPLNLVTFRHRGGDDVNQRILERINKGGQAQLTHTRLDHRYVLRVSIGQWRTQREHVLRVWQLIRQVADSPAR